MRQAQLNLGGGKYQNGVSVRKQRSMVEINEHGDSIDASILEEEDNEIGELQPPCVLNFLFHGTFTVAGLNPQVASMRHAFTCMGI